jgi:hypothetical protein
MSNSYLEQMYENLLEQKNPSDVLIEFCNYYKFNIAFEVDNNNATYD